MPRRPLDLLRSLFLGLALLFIGNLAAAQTTPAWNTQFGAAIHCGVPGNPACRITGGPGCNTTAVPGQCSFAKATAQAACNAHGACQALTCNATRPDCQARDGNEAQTLTPLAGFTSLRRVADAQAQFPGWATQVGGAIGCGVAGNPACRITGGPGCNTAAVPGQCSFAAATAPASCAAHGSCAALTCNVTRADCQARDAQEAQAWVPNASFISFARLTAATGGQGGGSTSGGGSTGSGSGSTPSGPTLAPELAAIDPQMTALLADMLEAVPFAAAQPLTHELISSLKKNAPGNWSARRGPVTVQLILTATAQALIVSLDGTIGVPSEWLDDELAEQISTTNLTDPMIVLSIVNGALPVSAMGPELKAIVAQSYFNAPGIDVRKGIQLVARANVGGYLGSTISTGLGVPVQNSILCVGKGAGLPTLPSQIVGGSNASTATGLGDAIRLMAKQAYDRKVEKQLKARGEKKPPDYFVQFQIAPDTAITGPMGMSPVTLRDATVYVSSSGWAGYKGNLSTSALPGKTFVGFLEAPYAAKGLIRITEFKFGLASPDLTLADVARVQMSFRSPSILSEQALQRLNAISGGLSLAEAPLSVIKLANPLPVAAPYRWGDATRPFPPAAHFNLMLLGPFATETLGGRLVKGPYLKAVGHATVLGKPVGSTAVTLNESGLIADVQGNLGTVDLRSVALGTPGFTARTQVAVDDTRQSVQIAGNVAGRTLTLNLSGHSIAIDSPATCATPVALSGSLALSANVGLGDVMGAVRGVTVDPARLANCTAAALQAAYQWISGNGRQLAGFGAGAANAALELIGLDDLQGAAREALTGAAAATTAAVSAGVNQSVGAAAGTANAGMDLGRDIGNFAAKLGVTLLNGLIDIFSGNFSSLVGGKSTDQVLEAQCNKRTGWMIDRAGRPEVHLEPFIQRVYNPLHAAIGKAHGLEQRLMAQHDQWQAADAAFFALSNRWNELSPAVGDVEGYRLRQQATAPLPASVAGRYQSLQTLTYVPPGGDTRTPVWNHVSARGRGLAGADSEYAKWVGWRVAKDSWKTARYTLQILHRCVEADVANVPQRMAEKLGTFRPLNVNGSPLYEEMDRPNNNNAYAAQNFARIIEGLENHIRGQDAWLTSTATWSNDFQAAWKFRTDGYRKALFAKMALGPWAQALAEHPASAQQFAALWSEYSAARLAVINQTGRWSDLNRIGTVADAQALASRVFNANAALRSAAIQYRPTAPADLQALIPTN